MSNTKRKRLTAEELKARRLPTDIIEIAGLGEVEVRGLSRKELIGFQQWDGLEQEQKIVAAAMLDPKMSEEDVAEWQEASPAGEINDVAMEINRLSGIAQGAAKSGVDSVRDEP